MNKTDKTLAPRRPPSLLKKDSHLTAGSGVQIIGKVQPDLSIKVLSALDLGTAVGKSSLFFIKKKKIKKINFSPTPLPFFTPFSQIPKSQP